MMSQIIPAFDRFLCQDLLGDIRIDIRIRRWRHQHCLFQQACWNKIIEQFVNTQADSVCGKRV